jgi:signal transduction histidine kinase
VSRDFSIRSAARATSSALDRIPIRWRLAGGSALLTLVILCGFAVAVGALTAQRLKDEFREDVRDAADQLRRDFKVIKFIELPTGQLRYKLVAGKPNLRTFVSSNDGAARIVIGGTGQVLRATEGAEHLGPPLAPTVRYRDWLVENRPVSLEAGPQLVIQYGQPEVEVEATVNRVRLFLVGGVIGGAGLALLAGLMIAKRAMEPIAELTVAAREIERTRDPGKSLPEPGPAEDEISELARTLEGMLHALAASRSEQEAMLARQREFVADASHELRTPLTSVLANLDFLAETLDGEQGDAARSALRSSQRMRRLVQDLLLLARADARRVAPHEPLDVGQVVVEAAAELEPVTDGHDLTVDAPHVMVDGARDELHRLILNLMENAVKHTPEGTHVRAAVAQENGHVLVSVEDDGPGIPADLREKVFERFVRGSGDRGGSFGLGLSIVRAVAESHGGTVALAEPENGHGTRFVVTLPRAGGPGAAA